MKGKKKNEISNIYYYKKTWFNVKQYEKGLIYKKDKKNNKKQKEKKEKLKCEFNFFFFINYFLN